MDSDFRERREQITAAYEAGTLSWKTIGTQEMARFPRRDGMVMVPVSLDERRQIDAFIEERRALREEVHALQRNPPATLDETEKRRLREHGIALFEGRVIFDAQPPATTFALESIAERCAGPIPQDLLDLWSVTFGGRLYYDLEARFEEIEEPMALDMVELFYEQSPHYRDLSGWIDHEIELRQDKAAAAGEPKPTTTHFLPFGGFEYLSRAYVSVSDEVTANAKSHAAYGSVWFWRKALPPAWEGRLKQDAAVGLAPNLRAFFSLLHVDAQRAADTYGHVLDVLGRLDTFKERDPELASLVRAYYLATPKAAAFTTP